MCVTKPCRKYYWTCKWARHVGSSRSRGPPQTPLKNRKFMS